MPTTKKLNAVRKEVDLDEEVLKFLGIGAKKDGRKLKNYLEKVLVDKAEHIRLLNGEKVGGKK